MAADVLSVLEAALDKHEEVRARVPALARFGSLDGAEAVAEYTLRFRRDDVPPLEISDPLDLFPADPLPLGMTPGLNWANPWPFARQAGVYLIYSMGLELLYVGKASMNRCLGQRLYDYFGDGDTCVLR